MHADAAFNATFGQFMALLAPEAAMLEPALMSDAELSMLQGGSLVRVFNTRATYTQHLMRNCAQNATHSWAHHTTHACIWCAATPLSRPRRSWIYWHVCTARTSDDKLLAGAPQGGRVVRLRVLVQQRLSEHSPTARASAQEASARRRRQAETERYKRATANSSSPAARLGLSYQQYAHVGALARPSSCLQSLLYFTGR